MLFRSTPPPPLMNDIQFSNFSPFLTSLQRASKTKKKLTGDKQKTNIVGIRRTRNHRPTRKRKTRCYGHKGKKKFKTKKNEMYIRVSRSIEEVSRIYQEEANLDGLRICRGSISQTKSFSMDRRSCRDSIKEKHKNLDGLKLCQLLSRKEERMPR